MKCEVGAFHRTKNETDKEVAYGRVCPSFSFLSSADQLPVNQNVYHISLLPLPVIISLHINWPHTTRTTMYFGRKRALNLFLVLLALVLTKVFPYATLNSGISPISAFASAPTLYDTLHLSFTLSTFLVLSAVYHTLTDWVMPRLCLGERVRPV